MPDDPVDPPPNDAAEELLAAAVQVLEQRGEPGLQEFLTAHATHADALHSGLERLRRMGLLAAPPAPPVEREQYGEFRILRRLADGGMGVVYLAEQTSLHRQVALKVVRPELLLSATMRERFQREVEAVARLQHPGIVPILAVGSEGSVPWFAMEYVEGHTLDELVTAMVGKDPARAGGRALQTLFDDRPAEGSGATQVFAGSYWEACVRLVLQVAQTMSYVHERGIVHRDLKPSNVVVTARGQSLLLDFGLAHVQDLQRLTRAEAQVGSPAYMAPEQVRGEAVDERVDVYGLGVTLYQLLATRLPFEGGSSERLQQQILAGAPRPLRAHNRAVPGDLAIVCAVAMDRDRSRRYGSMADFAQDLECVLARRPIRARPLGWPLRTLRFCQRHPAAAIATVCVLVVLLQFPLVLWQLQASANEQLAAANRQQVAANRELLRQRAEAQANFADTLTTIQELMLRTSQTDLAATPGGEQLRAALLQRAAAMYERLAARYPDDARLAGDAAYALQCLGALECTLGDLQAGERHLRASLAKLAHAVGPVDVGTRGVTRKLLAQSLTGRGRHAEAAAELRAALCDLEDASVSLPGDASFCRHFAETKNSLAIVCRELGDAAAELALLTSAQADKEALVRAAPHDLKAALSFAIGCGSLSQCLELRGRLTEARSVVEQGLVRLLDLRPEGADGAVYRNQLGTLFDQRGGLRQQAGELQEAAADHGNALALRLELQTEFPQVTRYASQAASSYHNLAQTEAARGHMALALDLEDESVRRFRALLQAAPQLVLPTQNLEYALVGRCAALLSLRRLDRLSTAVDELVAAAVSSEGLLNAARIRLAHAQLLGAADDAAATSRLRELAVEHIAAAVAKGFGDVAHFEQGRFARLYGQLKGMPAYEALLTGLRQRPGVSR